MNKETVPSSLWFSVKFQFCPQINYPFKKFGKTYAMAVYSISGTVGDAVGGKSNPISRTNNFYGIEEAEIE